MEFASLLHCKQMAFTRLCAAEVSNEIRQEKYQLEYSMPSALSVGDTYSTGPTDFLRSHGIPSEVDFVVTNIDGKLVSLFLKYSRGKQCPSKITLMKTYFGANFIEDPYAPRNMSYQQSEHYFPDVNEESAPLLPSSRYSR